MTIIKSYTDIEQSKKLEEILSLESADMYYSWYIEDDGDTIESGYRITTPNVGNFITHKINKMILPCWSLAALLGVASTYCSRLEITIRVDKKYNVFAVKDDFVFRSFDDYPDGFDNLVDTCYEMILKLHELNLL